MKLCDIFDEVKRVLKKSGTCWVNIGDTYAGSGIHNIENGVKSRERSLNANNDFIEPKNKDWKLNGIQSKCLIQIPHRFAIEMCNREWILRNVLIWHKPSCMPASVKDRFTVDFEYVFFFVKSKNYWFDQQLETSIDPESYSGRKPRNAGLVFNAPYGQ